MLNDIKGVAFDLDGTLYPNYSLNLRLVPFIIKEWRLLSAFGKARNIIREEQKNDPAKIHNNFYEYQAEITAKILSSQPELLKEKIERLIYRGWEPFFKNIKLFKQSKEALIVLRKAGYKMGLLSDFPPDTKLEYLRISDLWDATLCSEQCGALKPHSKSFIELAKAMDLTPDKILYVGNSHSYDVAGAARTGMKTAWIKSRFASSSGKNPKPDFSFHSYRQLIDFMLK